MPRFAPCTDGRQRPFAEQAVGVAALGTVPVRRVVETLTWLPLAEVHRGNSLLRLEINQINRDDFVRLTAAAVDIERETAGDAAVDGTRRIEHERSRSGDDTAGRCCSRPHP